MKRLSFIPDYKKASHLLLVTIIPLILSSCSTQTRFGDLLIPAHPRSNQSKGEKVVLTISQPETTKIPKNSSSGMSAQGLSGTAAKFLASQAIDFAVKEIKGEAKKYSAQYGAKKRNNFQKDGKYLATLTRSIDGNPTASSVSFALEIDDYSNGLSIVSVDLEEVIINQKQKS